MIVINISIHKWEKVEKNIEECGMFHWLHTGKNLKKQMITRFLSIVKWSIMNTSQTINNIYAYSNGKNQIHTVIDVTS